MENTKRELHKGDILLNHYAGWKTIFIYERTAGQLVHGYNMTTVKGKTTIEKGSYYKSTLYDEKSFPLIGRVNMEAAMIAATLQGITKYDLVKNEYDEETGHRKSKTSENQKTKR